MSGRNSSLQQAQGRGQHPQQGGGGRGGGYYPNNYQYAPPPPQQQQGVGGLRPMPPGPTGMGWQAGGEFMRDGVVMLLRFGSVVISTLVPRLCDLL
jgi:hypothetical protein